MSKGGLQFPGDVGVILRATWRYRQPLFKMCSVAAVAYIIVSLIFPIQFQPDESKPVELGELLGALDPFMGLYFLAQPFLIAVLSLGLHDVMTSGRYRPRAYLQRLWDRLLPLTGVLLLSFVAIYFAGRIFLIIPSFVLSFLLMFAPLAVLIDGAGIRESLGLSLRRAGGNFWSLLFIAVGAMLPVVVLQLMILMLSAATGSAMLLLLGMAVGMVVNLAVSTSIHTLAYMRLFTKQGR